MYFFIGCNNGALAMTFENFEKNPESNWKFISDQVMGGVSDGKIEFLHSGRYFFARMTGYVSLENDGGFIQFRKKVKDIKLLNNGIEINVRGNIQKYFVHIRTTGTILPWQYYQAPFEVINEWKTIKIPYDSFERSGIMLSRNINPKSITSIAIVAYGYVQKVLIDVENISSY